MNTFTPISALIHWFKFNNTCKHIFDLFSYFGSDNYTCSILYSFIVFYLHVFCFIYIEHLHFSRNLHITSIHETIGLYYAYFIDVNLLSTFNEMNTLHLHWFSGIDLIVLFEHISNYTCSYCCIFTCIDML